MFRTHDGWYEYLEMQSWKEGGEQKVKEKEPHALIKMRKGLEEKVTHYFSAQLCKVIFEEKEKSLAIKPIDLAKDPQTAQIIKHIFLLTEELEKIATIFGVFDESEELEIKESKEESHGSLLTSVAGLGADWARQLTRKPLHILKTVSHVATDIGPKIKQAQGPIQAALAHINKIWSMASGEGSFIQTKITEIQEKFASFLASIPDEAKSEQLSLRQRTAIAFPKLSNMLEQLIVGLCGVERPATPIGSEAKTEIEVAITDNLKEVKQTGGYVLFRCVTKKCWELFKISETDSQQQQLIKLMECPGLEEILASLANCQDAITKKSQIVQCISNRWDVSAQRRSEWLPVLHMSKQLTEVTRIWSEMATIYHKQMVQDGLLDQNATQHELIEKIKASLEGAHLDSNGYYEYSKNETPLTQSLKATYNVLWGINQLCKGHWENPGLRAYFDTAWHLYKTKQHYWKIDWVKLGPDIKLFLERIIDSVLQIVSEFFLPKLRAWAQTIHQLEMSNHARFGAVSELTNARSLFREIDRVYYQRGLDMGGNPSGYSQETAIILEDYKKEAEKKNDLLLEDANTLDTAINYYQSCFSKQSFRDRLTLFRHITKTRILLQKYRKTTWRIESDSTLRSLQQEITHTLTPAEADNIRAEYTTKDNLIHPDIQQLMQGKKGIKHWGSSINRHLRALSEEQVKTLGLTLSIAQKMRSHLAGQLNAVEEYKQAIAAHEKLRMQDAIETLEKEGIIALIAGTKGNDITKQRTLAVLLADFEGQPRAPYLKDAKGKTNKFIKSEKDLVSFIQQVSQHDPVVSEKIALEAYLAGYILKTESLRSLFSAEPLKAKNLRHILDHLPATCFFDFWRDDCDELTMVRRHTFSSLLKGEDSEEKSYSKATAIKALFDSYQAHQAIFSRESKEQPSMKSHDSLERQIMNKIGLFMGRLAHANDDTAQIVFGSKDYRQVLAKECLDRNSLQTERALFYEGLVSTFQFVCFDEQKKYFISDYPTLLEKNKIIAYEIYHAMHPDKEKIEREILKYYQDPLCLYQDVEKLIIHNLSPGSRAEDKMREFFSAVVLSQQAKPVRKDMLRRYHQAKGNLPVLSLFTNFASTFFWKEAQRYLFSDENLDLIFQKLDSKRIELEREITDRSWDLITPDAVRQQWYTQINALVAQKKTEARIESKELSGAKTDLPSKCLKFQTTIQQLQKNVDGDFEILAATIKARHQQEAELIELDRRLSRIIGILKPYLDHHSEFLGWVKKCLSIDELPFQKRNLVAKYSEQFKSLQENLRTVNSMSPADIKKEIQSIANNLSNEHASLRTKETTSDDKEFSGISPAIQQTVAMERIIETRLEEDISLIQRIARIVKNTILATFFSSNDAARSSLLEQKNDSQAAIARRSTSGSL